MIVSRDVSFDESSSLKEGENAQAPRTDKGKSPLLDVVEEEIHHYGYNDEIDGDAPIELERIPTQQELEKQDIAGEPQARAPDNEDQPEPSTRRASTRASRAPKRYGTWANSSNLEEHEIDPEDEDGDVLILEEESLLHTRWLELQLRSLSGMVLWNMSTSP